MQNYGHPWNSNTGDPSWDNVNEFSISYPEANMRLEIEWSVKQFYYSLISQNLYIKSLLDICKVIYNKCHKIEYSVIY